ncbi:MAG TPA: hypothetical protein PKA42_00675 [Candidatus Paceibacterota bacterium]|nr:hypothetical protein [Candidatus Paceibacterota bacterium]
MKRFSQQFNNKAKDITLSAAEKRELRERVVSYMEYHPLPNVSKRETAMVSGQEEHFILFNFNKWRILRWSGSMALLLVISTSYLAEKAVPGDVLYSVKVGFNEELRSTMVRGSYEKVVWETERLNRRIAEARLLADEGRLTHEVEVGVASAIKLHSDKARREIENLKFSDKDEATLASISLTTALDIQSASLNRRDDNTAKGVSQSTDLIKDILIKTQNAELMAQDNELPSYNKLIAKIESETTRAHELLKGVTVYATVLEQSDIKKRLDDIEKRIATAMSSFEADELAAKQGLVKALQQTHRLIVFMTNIDVRANLTVEELVPNTLTIEERFEALRIRGQQTEGMIKTAEIAMSTSTATSVTDVVTEKVLPAIENAKTNIVDLNAFLLNANEAQLEAMEALALDAYYVMSDVIALLGIPASEALPELKPETPQRQDIIRIDEKDSTATGTVQEV